jgi:hypothetical protein
MQKWLYKFEIEIKGEKKTFGIIRPSRRLREEGEVFFAAQTSKFVKAGILPKAAWSTILSNGGGSISEQDRELYGNLLIAMRDKGFELQKCLIKKDNKENGEALDSKINLLTEELNNIKNDLQAFESSQISIFENTAEAKARNKTIMWWVAKLSKELSGDSAIELLKGESHDEQLDYYDELEEDAVKNKMILYVLRRLTYLITLWFLGRISNEEDFSLYDKEFLKSDALEDKPQSEDSGAKKETETIVPQKQPASADVIEELTV